MVRLSHEMGGSTAGGVWESLVMGECAVTEYRVVEIIADVKGDSPSGTAGRRRSG